MFKRSRVSMGALVALAAMAGVAASAVPEGRHFLLEDNNAAPGTVRFLSQVIELGADTSKPSWVTVTRTGDFTDPRYGQFSITPTMLAQMVSQPYLQALAALAAHFPNLHQDDLRSVRNWTVQSDAPAPAAAS